MTSSSSPKGDETLNWFAGLQTYQILMGLDDIYTTLHTNDINMGPFLSLDRVHIVVMQEESHRGLTTFRDPVTVVGFNAQTDRAPLAFGSIDPNRTPKGR